MFSKDLTGLSGYFWTAKGMLDLSVRFRDVQILNDLVRVILKLKTLGKNRALKLESVIQSLRAKFTIIHRHDCPIKGVLTENIRLAARFISRRAFSFFPSHAGMVSIKLLEMFRTWRWTKVSNPSILSMQLQLRSNSRNLTRWSTFSIFCIWLKPRRRTCSLVTSSNFSIYCRGKKKWRPNAKDLYYC